MTCRGTLLLCLLLGFSATVSGQLSGKVGHPARKDFLPRLQTLSGESMQGRETGTPGGRKAGDYMAAEMQRIGLEKPDGSYFQPFTLIRSEVTDAGIVFSQSRSPEKGKQLRFGRDFIVLPCAGNVNLTAETADAGFGLISADSAYNDFREADVRGKVAVLTGGYPGMADATGELWQRYGKALMEKGEGMAAKVRNAASYGALAVVLLQPGTNAEAPGEWFAEIRDDLADNYPDGFYAFASAAAEPCLPVFAVASESIRKDELLERSITFTATVESGPFEARNVTGLIRGADTSRCIIIGGHYDHLGMRGDDIYYGADDNASGASGVLALAEKWAESGVKPPVNLLFASWDAEEKGLFGSTRFVNSPPEDFPEILTYINLDVISRSEPADTLGRMLSVGIREGDSLRQRIVSDANRLQEHPFTLEIWDVTGHSGSDYGPFAEAGIPVLTFFSGYHDDYHSPRDRFERIDAGKMEAILRLVNNCLISLLENLPGH